MLKELVERKVLRVVSGYAVVCFVVLQIADVTFEPLGIGSGTLRAIIAIMILGFPIVTYLAWIFDVSGDRELVKQSSGRLEGALFVIALALFGFGVWLTLFDDGAVGTVFSSDTQAEIEPVSDQPTVVVVPFTNMSPDPKQDYFVAGLSEELIGALSTSRQLAVVARSSSFSLKDRPLTIAEISNLVNATHVVEGSVRKRGDLIRVTVTLSEVSSGTQLWAQSFDRALKDVFALQENIATSVAHTLHAQLDRSSVVASDTDSPAHALYLRARGILSLNENTAQHVSIAKEALDEALELDPNYVPALLELSRLLLRMEQVGVVELDSLIEERNVLVNRALQIAPNHPTANAYMGWSLIWNVGDYPQGLEFYRKALAIAPYEPEILRGFSRVLLHLGHVDLALQVAKFVALRDPLCGICSRNLADAHLTKGEYEEGAEVLKQMYEIAPTAHLGYLRALIAIKVGDYANARELVAVTSGGEQTRIVSLLDIVEGKPDALHTSIGRVKQLGPAWQHAIADFYFLAGQADDAVAHLQLLAAANPQTVTTPYPWWVTLFWKDYLFDDPRHDAIRRQLEVTPVGDEDIGFEVLAGRG